MINYGIVRNSRDSSLFFQYFGLRCSTLISIAFSDKRKEVSPLIGKLQAWGTTCKKRCREYIVVYIGYSTRTFTSSWVSIQKFKPLSVNYALCHSTVERLYAYRIAIPTISYSNSSMCFYCSISSSLLRDNLLLHSEHQHWKSGFQICSSDAFGTFTPHGILASV